jgi:hypothetical protein
MLDYYLRLNARCIQVRFANKISRLRWSTGLMFDRPDWLKTRLTLHVGYWNQIPDILTYISPHLTDLFLHVKCISYKLSRIPAYKVFCKTFCRKLKDFLPKSGTGGVGLLLCMFSSTKFQIPKKFQCSNDTMLHRVLWLWLWPLLAWVWWFVYPSTTQIIIFLLIYFACAALYSVKCAW